MSSPYDILLRPVITEQSMTQMEQGKYTFVVDRRANKTEIRRAVEQLFNVKVAQVNTINVPGKPKRLGRFEGRRPGYKKAIVTLREGYEISQFFEDLL